MGSEFRKLVHRTPPLPAKSPLHYLSLGTTLYYAFDNKITIEKRLCALVCD